MSEHNDVMGFKGTFASLSADFYAIPGLPEPGGHIVDWSPDGRLLLTEMWQWNTEPNDAPIPRSILVFEPQKKVKHQIDLYRLMADQKGRDCDVQFDLLGFTPDNWVSLKARFLRSTTLTKMKHKTKVSEMQGIDSMAGNQSLNTAASLDTERLSCSNLQ